MEYNMDILMTYYHNFYIIKNYNYYVTPIVLHYLKAYISLYCKLRV